MAVSDGIGARTGTRWRSRIVVESRVRVRDEQRRLGRAIRDLRRDAGISQRRLAAAAEMSRSHLSGIEAGREIGSWESLARIATALGADLAIRVYPGTGPRLRDGHQAAMLEELVRVAHRRWQRRLEVTIYHPARGYIDLVLMRPGEAIAVEVQSELRRVEEQLRWHQAKAEGLAEALAPGSPAAPGNPPGRGNPAASVQIGRLLVLRSSARTRHVVATHPELFAAAYPTPIEDALAALRGPAAPWPGPALLWMRLEDGRATLLDRPPRGIRLGR